MNLRELVAQLECEFKPQHSETEVFIARDGYSLDLRNVEAVTMCRENEHAAWRPCTLDVCYNEKKKGILLR